MNSERWRLVEEHFNAALALARAERAAYIDRISRGDPELRIEIESLLRASDAAVGFLEEPASTSHDSSMQETLASESRLGAWRIVRLIGHGGMGEVYEAERADGQFELRAALKVTRREASRFLERFNAERQILARLDHPGIARLLDGGVAPDGRPFAVMEYVEGVSITRHCAERHADLRARLLLFLQVCDAVSHAHRHLIVHRDIKPGNVLVDREGRARLLDFGIAKPLDVGLSAAADFTVAPLTPDYAAPEQLAGEPVTTATDVYALGVLLFELLSGRKPWSLQGEPLARALHALLEQPAPPLSETAGSASDAPVSPRSLQGDLDAIVAKCLRREPQHRYATVNALKLDIERSLAGDPVLARSDARFYVLGRLLRRYRWATAAVVAIIAILAAGIAATAWQADRATREAARATATRDFLLSVFRESDPRIARGRPPGEITAKELLDTSVERVESEFARDPETQLALLTLASEIYGYWADEERFVQLLEKRKNLARKHYGESHPLVIESLIIDAWGSIYPQDFATADRLLDEADRLIRKGGHEKTGARGAWWLAKAEVYKVTDPPKRLDALERSVDLFRRYATEHADFGVALALSASARLVREDFEGAKQRNEEALVVLASADVGDIELAGTYANLGRALQHLGDFKNAEVAFQKHAELRARAFALKNGVYWQGAAEYARLVHLRGDRERALRMFAELLVLIPPDWDLTTDDVVAREFYAERLAAEGRAAEAIPLLETAQRTYVERPMRDYDLRRLRQTLGDAYDRAGRADDARVALAAARAERMQKDAPDSIAVLSARERWARFLLSTGEIAAATAELKEIVQVGGDKQIFPLALAHGDLAQAAIARRDASGALSESRAAIAALDRITGLYDVRIGPMLWRTHAAALRLNGDPAGAAQWNQKALIASRQYDDPSSPTLSLASTGRR